MKRTIHDWLRHFENHRAGWSAPDWEHLPPCRLDPERRRLLAESLAIFQIGETGGGTRLRRFVTESAGLGDRSREAVYARAVDLFIAEENDHARLLAGMVGYLGGELKRKHWANSVFRSVRTWLGLEFNLQVLLTAELIADAYYGLLARAVPDAVVSEVCGRIVRDEAGHIGFHRTYFSLRHRGRLPVGTALWGLQFQMLYLMAEALVWREHGACLRAFGIGRAAFQSRGRAACRRFLSLPDGGAGEADVAFPASPAVDSAS